MRIAPFVMLAAVVSTAIAVNAALQPVLRAQDLPAPVSEPASDQPKAPFGAAVPIVREVPGATAAPAASTTPAPYVDETALRYFASQGDTKRLESEIARLRALYPNWTPPADPLAVSPQTDPRLDALWKLYSEGKLAEMRKAIADRQTAEPAWTPPADLLERLAVAEAREQLVNASNLKQYETVVRVGSANSSLLTCADVDVLWRVAEALALSDRKMRAKDAYLYILNSCDDAAVRLATVQKASLVMPHADLEALLATERKTANGTGEFEPLRLDLARNSLAAANADPKLMVTPEEVAAVEKAATADGQAADALLLGWYRLGRNEPAIAETWFGKAEAAENSAVASQGLALAMIAQDRPVEAEAVLYEWRATSAEIRDTYLAAVTNLLAISPPTPLEPDRLQRMVAEIAAGQDAAAAQELGWYADALNQFETAELWFGTALGWKPDDEPSAYGLALMRWKLGDKAGAAEIQRAWAGKSERIAAVGKPEPRGQRKGRQRSMAEPATDAASVGATGQELRNADEAPELGYAPVSRQPRYAPVAPRRTAVSREPRYAEAPQPRASAEYEPAAPQRIRRQPLPQRNAGCSATIDPARFSPNEAASRGWCLLELNRPLEAAAAFEVGLGSRTQRVREDAAYGQSLAYIRAGLDSNAAAAAVKAPQSQKRSVELQTSMLASQALRDFEAKNFTRAIFALDERARIAPERIDLMVLRGYAYLGLRRFDDAEHIFRAVAATGDSEGPKGLSNVRDERSTKR